MHQLTQVLEDDDQIKGFASQINSKLEYKIYHLTPQAYYEALFQFSNEITLYRNSRSNWKEKILKFKLKEKTANWSRE